MCESLARYELTDEELEKVGNPDPAARQVLFREPFAA